MQTTHTETKTDSQEKKDYYFVSMEKMPENGFESFKRSVKLSLGADIIKGLGLTIKEFFSKPVTINYPFETQPLSHSNTSTFNM